MSPLDDEIARKLQQAAASGELRAAPSWGRPMPPWEGWDDTPAELRMPYKILKDAGYAPPELGLFRRRAELRARVAAAAGVDTAEAAALRRELADVEQRLALRLEGLRLLGTL